MVHIMLEGLMALLIALGLGVVLWLLFGRLFPVQHRAVVVVKAGGAGADLEQKVRGLLWLRQSGLWSCPLILLDCGLQAEGQEVARRLAGDHPWITLCTREELVICLENVLEE